MNYIVLDLEWNQSPLGKLRENKDLPFEIIEIGAVKLGRKKNIESEFSEVIKPQVYNEIHYKIKDIIKIQMDELKTGDDFVNVITRFFDWCGTDYTFCTWGSMDLTELQRNMKHYNITGFLEKPIKYYDIQLLFGLMNDERNIPRNLEYAVDYLHINKEDAFHRALCDAKYAALVFQTIEQKIQVQNYSVDYYQNPKRKEEEIRIIYDSYSKEISMEYNSKEDALRDKDVCSTVCFKCGRKTIKKVKWFSYNVKAYGCLLVCKEHGYLIGNIHVKRSQEGKIFIEKTIRLANKEDAVDLCVRQDEVREKKKNKVNKRSALRRKKE